MQSSRTSSTSDHLQHPVYVAGKVIAFVEVLFGAPTTESPAAFMYTPNQRRWYDFSVHEMTIIKGCDHSSGRRTKFVRSDLSWLRRDMRPDRLVTSTTNQGSSDWRGAVVELLCQWVQNCWIVKEHDRFVRDIGIYHDRLTFEYHSFLCGVGDSSSDWNTTAIRSDPSGWLKTHPRVIAAIVHGHQEEICNIRMPLFQDSNATWKLRERLRLWMELYCKLAGHQQERSEESLRLEATLNVELRLSNKVSYRVERESLNVNFALQSNDIDQKKGSDPYSPAWWRDLLQKSCNLSDNVPLLHASPSTSPRVTPANHTQSSTTIAEFGVPSFSSIHRQQNATLMEYVPVVESAIIDLCVHDCLHFLSLAHAITEYLGQPTAFTTTARSAPGKPLDKSRQVVFTVTDRLLNALVDIRYIGMHAAPIIEVRCLSHSMPTAPVRLNPVEALQFAAGDTAFNVQVMAQHISAGAHKRVQQMVEVVALTLSDEMAALETRELKHRQSIEVDERTLCPQFGMIQKVTATKHSGTVHVDPNSEGIVHDALPDADSAAVDDDSTGSVIAAALECPVEGHALVETTDVAETEEIPSECRAEAETTSVKASTVESSVQAETTPTEESSVESTVLTDATSVEEPPAVAENAAIAEQDDATRSA